MKLRLVIVTALVAALFCGDAAAGMELQTKTRKGVNTTSRFRSGDCGFRNDYYGVGDVLLRCSGPNGRAKVRYDFYLPKGLYGTPTMYTYTKKLCCSGSVIKKTLQHVSGRHYRIVINAYRATRLDIRSVCLSYYVKT